AWPSFSKLPVSAPCCPGSRSTDIPAPVTRETRCRPRAFDWAWRFCAAPRCTWSQLPASTAEPAKIASGNLGRARLGVVLVIRRQVRDQTEDAFHPLVRVITHQLHLRPGCMLSEGWTTTQQAVLAN